MSRNRTTVPSYQKHSSGCARVRTYDASGKRIEMILPGEYGSKESKDAYAKLLLQLKAGGEATLPARTPDITVAELVLKFMEHAETYYVDGVTKKPTSEVLALTAAFRPLTRLYGDISATEFGPLALKNVREAMISGDWLADEEKELRRSTHRPIGLARSTINKNVNRIKLVFKWGASMELVPSSVCHGLQSVTGLRRGRSAARETESVKPVSPAIIDDTLPHLPPVVRDMVEVLLLTGMRCGELCIMRASDLNMSGEIWLYRPERHKSQWRNNERVIAIGPQAQVIIKKYLGMKMDAYLFSPAAQDGIIQAAKRAKRKTPLQPSQQNRRKPDGKRRPGDRFGVDSVNHAIRRVCGRVGIDRWHVHQLRHSASLAFSRELGLEAARAALGHASVDMSAIYAGRDLETAKEVARRIG